jgi:hypothetical protein
MGERGPTHGVRRTLYALPRPLCRYASIILPGDDAWLLTELSNVAAYICRHSLREVRHHGLLCTPSAGNQGFSLQGFAAPQSPPFRRAGHGCAGPPRIYCIIQRKLAERVSAKVHGKDLISQGVRKEAARQSTNLATNHRRILAGKGEQWPRISADGKSAQSNAPDRYGLSKMQPVDIAHPHLRLV